MFKKTNKLVINKIRNTNSRYVNKYFPHKGLKMSLALGISCRTFVS